MRAMRFLVTDTAGSSLRVALSDGTHVRDTDRKNASALLMPSVDALLRAAGISLSDLDYIACVTGPGSFTGIRIGVSTVRSLCYACRRPALGMHSLQTLAYNERADTSARILCVSDGSNGTAYVAEYDKDRHPIADTVCMELDAALQRARAFDGAVCADETLAALLPQAIAPDEDCRTLVRAAAALGKNAGDWQNLLPVYVRLSQAEREWEEKAHAGLS